MTEFANGGPIRGNPIFQLEPGCPSYLIPKSAAERLAHHRGLLEQVNRLPGGGSGGYNGGGWPGSDRPHLTFRWCWDCGLRRVDPWRIDDHTHVRRLPCGCITTEED